MKYLYFLYFIVLLSIPITSRSQSATPTPSPTPSGIVAPTVYAVAERGANYNIWESTNSQSIGVGQHRFVEWATGLNYTNASGHWVPAREEIDACSSGAIAQYGQHQVSFANDLNTVGAIDVMMPDGKHLQSDILGLSYYDTASGTNVVIAEVTDCQGEIVGSNQVVYANAFNGVNANVCYTYTKAGLEQDVILLEQPPTPESFGLSSASSVLQVITEFTSAPTPTVTASTAGSSLPDEWVNFGAMQLIRGKAFLLGTNLPAVAVARQWATLDLSLIHI